MVRLIILTEPVLSIDATVGQRHWQFQNSTCFERGVPAPPGFMKQHIDHFAGVDFLTFDVFC